MKVIFLVTCFSICALESIHGHPAETAPAAPAAPAVSTAADATTPGVGDHAIASDVTTAFVAPSSNNDTSQASPAAAAGANATKPATPAAVLKDPTAGSRVKRFEQSVNVNETAPAPPKPAATVEGEAHQAAAAAPAPAIVDAAQTQKPVTGAPANPPAENVAATSEPAKVKDTPVTQANVTTKD